MRPVPWPKDAVYEGFELHVIAGPNGDLLNDGSNPEEALPVDAQVGIDPHSGWPCFIIRMVPESGDLEQLAQDGGYLELRFYTRQMPVHSVTVMAP